MAKTKLTSRTPRAASRETLSRIASDIVGIMKPFVEAGSRRDRATADLASSGEASIRAMTSRLHGINVTLDDDDITDIASEIVEGLGYEGKSAVVRRSEYKTLIETRQKLPGLLAGIDKLSAQVKQRDPSAAFNIRQHVLSAARMARRDADKTTAEIMSDLRARVLKPEPTDQSRASALIEKLSEAKAFRVTVGDETMLDDDAGKLLAGLEVIAAGGRPSVMVGEIDTSTLPEVQALRKTNASLRARVRALEATLAGNAPAEPAGGLQDGNEPERLPTHPGDGDGAPVATGSPLEGIVDEPEPLDDDTQPGEVIASGEDAAEDTTGSRATSISESLTGMSFDELIDITTPLAKTPRK